MSDPRDESIVPPANVTDGLTVRCPEQGCGRVIAQAWRDRGEVYVRTAHLVTRCAPKVHPWIPASCSCKGRQAVHRLDAAKIRQAAPHKGRRGVAFVDVGFS